VGSCDVALRPGQLSPSSSLRAHCGTAGAITLITQASLVPLLFAGGPCKCDLRGGTDVAWSPPLGFLKQVLRPTLARMGASFEVQCEIRGFYPQGGGHCILETKPVRAPLKAIDMSTRGDLTRANVTLFSCRGSGRAPPDAAQISQRVESALRKTFEAIPGIAIHITLESPKSLGEHIGKQWAEVVVESSSGALFHGSTEPKDLPGFGKAKGKGGLALSDVFVTAACAAASSVLPQLEQGCAVDVHLADQLILPASLASGTSKFLLAEPSLHTQTAIYIAKLMVPGLKVKEERKGKLTLLEIEGIAFDGELMPSEVANEGIEIAGSRSDDYDEELLALPSQGKPLKANSDLRRDFEADMKALSEEIGASIVVNAGGDKLVVSGTFKQREDANAQLTDILAFYFADT